MTDSEQPDASQESRSVRCCTICGAVITEETTATHDEWHNRLDARMKAADSGIGFMGMFGTTDPARRL